MLRLHHVNLSIPVGGAEAEAAFLVDFLDYRRMDLLPSTPPMAKWFECADGTQIHLSEDPEHHPSALAHVAVELGEELAALEAKFDRAGYKYRTFDQESGRIVFCQDPAGNRWELRGAPAGS
jgi:catechol 2,3-dioxygenase-like lactoylglutathione lyase family enzyme